MGVEIAAFDSKTASREEWARYHVFRRIRHQEESPDGPLASDEKEEIAMKRDDPEGEDFIYAAYAPGRDAITGMLWFGVFREFSPSYAANGHIAWVGVGVIRPCRRRGIATALLRLAPELARQHRIQFLMGWASEDDGKAFVRALGAKVGSRRRENRLYLDRVDWSMVESWAREGPVRSPQTRLRWFRDRIDDDILEPYAKVYTEVMNQQPWDDLERGGDFIHDAAWFRDREDRAAAMGETRLTVIAVEPDGDISGLTETVYDADDVHIIGQGLTGVREPYRSRGLGKWLKAEMLLRVRHEFPKVRIISTWNATTNAAMLAINEKLGFREHRVSEMPQISVEALEAWLARAPGLGSHGAAADTASPTSG